jgi:MAE_28990/MAE_18760-like HEPN
MTEIDSKLLEAITERVTVIFELERTIFTRRYNLSKRHQEILSTQSISILYSIWEGFVQTSFNLYIDELNKFDLEVYDFCDVIIIHQMENSFKQFKEYPIKESQKIKYLQSLKSFYSLNKHPMSRVINTQSNVGLSVLNKLLITFSLDPFTDHRQNYTHPNSSLKDTMVLFLKLRNTVAHGGDLISEEKIDHAVFVRFKVLILDLMYELRARMLNGLSKESFRRLT